MKSNSSRKHIRGTANIAQMERRIYRDINKLYATAAYHEFRVKGEIK